jgi:hypothetical protein
MSRSKAAWLIISDSVPAASGNDRAATLATPAGLKGTPSVRDAAKGSSRNVPSGFLAAARAAV